jgi:glycosyltransferase involved in cell wall biosynthesis
MDVSVVIPVRDEQDTIPILVDRLVAVLGRLVASYEIIFVTDVNTDRTWEVLKEQRERNRNISVLKLSGSFGHHVAVIAGLEVSRGKSVVLMDGDLEMLPEEIPKLYAKHLEGFDVVYGWSRTKNASFVRDLASRAFNAVMSMLSDQSMTQNTDMFRVISRRTVTKVLQFGEHEPSLTHIMGLINLPSAGVEVAFVRRERGNTKYSFRRQLNFAISSLVSFSTKPIRLIVTMGLLISGTSFLFLAVVAFQKIFVRGYGGLGEGTIIVMFTFFGGLQLLAIGVLGEYIGRIFIQSKSRPRYIVEEQLLGDGQKE